jgi:DNA-binding CsgD family transcriptional regulator
MVTEQETLITTQQETTFVPDISSQDEQQTLTPGIAEPEQTISELVPEEQELPSSPVEQEPPSSPAEPQVSLEDQIAVYLEGLSNLTPTERIIYDMYISKNTTKEIMAALNIKENTLKFHNKNIYSKLGVSSRKQLIELSKHLNT